MLKLVSTIILSLFAATLSEAASDSVKIIKKFSDGTIKEESVKLEKLGANSYRLKIPARKLDENVFAWRNANPVEYIDIISQDACAAKGDKCYDCSSPERICRALTVLWEKPTGVGRAEVVLIDEDLGY